MNECRTTGVTARAICTGVCLTQGQDKSHDTSRLGALVLGTDAAN